MAWGSFSIISAYFKSTLCLNCEVYSCRHVLYLHMNRNKNSLYKKDKINRMNIAGGTFEEVCARGMAHRGLLPIAQHCTQ